MIRTTAARPARAAGAALAGAAGLLALAGCAANAADAETGGGGPYRDGTYTAQGSYTTPETVESISVTVTLASDRVTAVEVAGSPKRPETRQYQSQFIGGIQDAVVGKDIDTLSVSRVAGSSLTSGGFNQAISKIRAEAAE